MTTYPRECSFVLQKLSKSCQTSTMWQLSRVSNWLASSWLTDLTINGTVCACGNVPSKMEISVVPRPRPERAGSGHETRWKFVIEYMYLRCGYYCSLEAIQIKGTARCVSSYCSLEAIQIKGTARCVSS